MWTSDSPLPSQRRLEHNPRQCQPREKDANARRFPITEKRKN